MSMKSQENNMRRLAALLSRDLSYIWGEKEGGPNGAKKAFLNLGKVFLRALAKDLGLRDVRVMSNPGGIAVSGECCLYGMWVDSGLFICIKQTCVGEDVFLYRTIRNINDHKGGYNRYVKLRDLKKLSYGQLLDLLSELRKDGNGYERAA
ncbi:MAG: hypothetical protein ACLU6E_02055 [Dysosmobacter welbionis]|uniref:hypothetical protein n=1 Tax=Dysosmobacter welbionis TaxID=2093857 RepID=UPI00399AFA7B